MANELLRNSPKPPKAITSKFFIHIKNRGFQFVIHHEIFHYINQFLHNVKNKFIFGDNTVYGDSLMVIREVRKLNKNYKSVAIKLHHIFNCLGREFKSLNNCLFNCYGLCSKTLHTTVRKAKKTLQVNNGNLQEDVKQ